MTARPLHLALLILACSAASANAAGINLAWNDCASSGGTANKLFACGVNTGQDVLVGSFVLPFAAPAVIGLDAIIDIINEPTYTICDPIPPNDPHGCVYPPLPSWWQLQAGGCRANALSVVTNFLQPPFGTGVCMDFWQNQAVGISNYEWNVNATGQARLRIVAAIPADQAASLAEDQEYYGFQVVLRHTRAIGTDACEGCCTPVTLFCEQMTIVQNYPAYDVVLSWSDTQSWVTWNNGNLACVTPARNRTWGGIKAMYR
jgi:hypothetical protein